MTESFRLYKKGTYATVFICDTKEEMYNLAEHRHPDSDGVFEENYGGLFVPQPEYKVKIGEVFFYREQFKLPIIFHEFFHLACAYDVKINGSSTLHYGADTHDDERLASIIQSYTEKLVKKIRNTDLRYELI